MTCHSQHSYIISSGITYVPGIICPFQARENLLMLLFMNMHTKTKAFMVMEKSLEKKEAQYSINYANSCKPNDLEH